MQDLIRNLGTSLTKILFDQHPNISTMHNGDIKENEGCPLSHAVVVNPFLTSFCFINQ